jgi:DNA-binding response OmpR family regulator
MSRQASILIVDDDPLTARLVRSHLERAGYHARSVASGQVALDLIADAAPSLVILGTALSPLDGYAVCEEIRGFSRVPVVMLAAEGEQADKLRGFAAGADDYLTKPFSPQELVARVGAVLRRSQQIAPLTESTILRRGTIAIDTARRRVAVGDEAVRLTPTEYRLLLHLVRNAGMVLSHAQLLTAVWGPEYRDDRQYLWVYIRSLRRKLEADPRHPALIRSEPGFGYVLDAPPLAA